MPARRLVHWAVFYVFADEALAGTLSGGSDDAADWRRGTHNGAGSSLVWLEYRRVEPLVWAMGAGDDSIQAI